jgi:hypothetical protein
VDRSEDGSKWSTPPPGHIEAVRTYVFDTLTKPQQRHLREIGRRIMRAIDPNDRCLDDGHTG